MMLETFFISIRIIIFLSNNSFTIIIIESQQQATLNTICAVCNRIIQIELASSFTCRSMSEICGQCNNYQSIECEIVQYCPIHDSNCFLCKRCNQQDEEFLEVCSKCSRQYETVHMFYDVRCRAYLCRYQFEQIITDHDINRILLKCGCWQLKEHVLAFVTNFCYQCMRRLSNPSPTIRQLCNVCFVQLGDKKLFGEQQPFSAEGKEEREESQTYQVKLKAIQIEYLKQRIQNREERLNISRYTYMQFKKALRHQREDQCLLCLQLFSLLRKPMMVCLQQHLICEKCFRTVKGLTNCPLCRDVISSQKVRVCRQRMKTLQIQNLIAKKLQRHKSTQRQLKNKSTLTSYTIFDHQSQDELIIMDNSNKMLKKETNIFTNSAQDRISQK